MTNNIRLDSLITVIAILVAVAIILLQLPEVKTARDIPYDNFALEEVISVNGFVDNPLNLSLQDLKEMPRTTVYAEMICVSGKSFGYANWSGVKLKDVLTQAGIQPAAIKIAFHATDGYTTDLTIEDAMRDEIIISYEKNNVAIDERTRLVVPGKWGYKWIGGISAIELVDYDFKGMWESRGYPDSAEISE